MPFCSSELKALGHYVIQNKCLCECNNKCAACHTFMCRLHTCNMMLGFYAFDVSALKRRKVSQPTPLAWSKVSYWCRLSRLSNLTQGLAWVAGSG